VSENLTLAKNPLAERKALGLLKSIIEENRGSLQLEGRRLAVTRRDGGKYFIDLRSAKVYDEHGKFFCLRVFGSGLPLIDQVIAKSLYLLTSQRRRIWADHDLLFKVTFIGSDPNIEWPWINSMSLSSLEQTFSKLIGVDFAIKRINIGDLTVKLQIWYLNSATQFKFIGVRYLQGSMGSVVLCAGEATSEKLLNLQRNIDDLRLRSRMDLPIVLVRVYDEASGHSENGASFKEEEELAKHNNIPFFPCSLKHPSTTDMPLACLTNLILRRPTGPLAT
jgi:hypothetical protein